MVEYVKFEIIAPDGVEFVDGPPARLASDGGEYQVYGFATYDVALDDIEARKIGLIAYYRQWFVNWCGEREVKTIEWRTKPEIMVRPKPRSRNKLFTIQVYSRFYSPEAAAFNKNTISILESELRI